MEKKFLKRPETPKILVNIGNMVGILDLNKRGLEEKSLENSEEYRETEKLLKDLDKFKRDSYANEEITNRFKIVIKNNKILSTGKEEGPMSAIK